MKKLLLSGLLLSLLSLPAIAQLTYGPEAGFNISDYNLTDPGLLQPTSLWVPGFHIGGIADYAVSKHVSVQPGAFYALNGIKLDYTFFLIGSVTSSAHINTIRIPINVQYKFGDAAGNRFFAGIGPFIGINLSGSAKVNAQGGSLFPGKNIDSSGTLKVGSDSSDYVRRFDFGAGVNAGYEWLSGLFVRAYYQRGFVNLAPVAGGEGVIKSVNFGVSVGYLFNHKPKKKVVPVKKPVFKR